MRKKAFIFAIIALFVASLAVNVTISDRTLCVNKFRISTAKTDESFRFVLISDLHNKEFGKNNCRLLKKIKEQKPAFIAVVGDFVTDSVEDSSVAVSCIKGLRKIAPVYFSLGNHERSYYDPEKLKSEIRSAGAVLLDDEMTQIPIGSDKITIGGLTDFPYYEYFAPEYNNRDRRFLDSFIAQGKNRFSILLMHPPEFFMWGLDKKELDLVLCGHTHGGIIRLPYIGGLTAPNQGVLRKNGDLLPLYTKGLYSSKTANMLITSGLGNEVPVPRYFNPPEIAVIEVNSAV